MVELVNPHTGKVVLAQGELVDFLVSVGFTKVEPKPAVRRRARQEASE